MLPSMKVSWRPETPEDEPFVRYLIVENVSLQLSASFWPEPMRETLLGMQYSARRDSIRNRYPEAQSRIILLDGEKVGWWVVALLPYEVRLVDIVIHVGQRGKGIGSAVIQELLEIAHDGSRPVRLNVNAANSGAIRLYARFGFQDVSGDEVQRSMEHRDATNY